MTYLLRLVVPKRLFSKQELVSDDTDRPDIHLGRNATAWLEAFRRKIPIGPGTLTTPRRTLWLEERQ
jgi:hypothetical protein